MAIKHVYNDTVADGSTGQVRPSDWNSAHNYTQLIGGNTAGASSVSGTEIYFAGSNNITLSITSNTINIIGAGGTVNQTGPNIAVAGSTVTGGTVLFSNANNASFGLNGSTLTFSTTPVSAYIPYFPASTSSQTIAAAGTTSASAFIFPLSIGVDAVYGNKIQILQSASYVSSTAAGSATHASQWGLYTNNAGTLSQITSGSYSIGVTNSSVSATFNYPNNTDPTGYTYGTTGLTTTAQIQSLFGTVGNRRVGLAIGSQTLTAGLYWVAILATNSTSGYNGGLSTALVGNNMGAAQSATWWGQASSAGTATGALNWFWGPYTSTGSAGYGGRTLPVSIHTSGIANTIAVMPMFTVITD